MGTFKKPIAACLLLLSVFGAGASLSCPLTDFGKKSSTVVTGHIPPTTDTDFEWGSEVRPQNGGARVWNYVKNLHRDPVAFTWPKAEMVIPFYAPLLSGHVACVYGYADANGYILDHDAPIIPSRDGIKNAEAFVRTSAKSKTSGAAVERDDTQAGAMLSRFAKLIFNYSASDKDLKIDVETGPGDTLMAFRPEAVGIRQADFLTELKTKDVNYKGFFPLSQLATSEQVRGMDLPMDQSYILMSPSHGNTLEFREFILRPSGLTPLLLFSPTGTLIAVTRIDTGLLVGPN